MYLAVELEGVLFVVLHVALELVPGIEIWDSAAIGWSAVGQRSVSGGCVGQQSVRGSKLKKLMRRRSVGQCGLIGLKGALNVDVLDGGTGKAKTKLQTFGTFSSDIFLHFYFFTKEVLRHL